MERTRITALLLRISKQSADTSLHLCQHWGCAEIKWPAWCHQARCISKSKHPEHALHPPPPASSTLHPPMHPGDQDGVLQRMLKSTPDPTPPRAQTLRKSNIRRFLINQRALDPFVHAIPELHVSMLLTGQGRILRTPSSETQQKPQASACEKCLIALQPSSVIKESGGESKQALQSPWKLEKQQRVGQGANLLLPPRQQRRGSRALPQSWIWGPGKAPHLPREGTANTATITHKKKKIKKKTVASLALLGFLLLASLNMEANPIFKAKHGFRASGQQ